MLKTLACAVLLIGAGLVSGCELFFEYPGYDDLLRSSRRSNDGTDGGGSDDLRLVEFSVTAADNYLFTDQIAAIDEDASAVYLEIPYGLAAGAIVRFSLEGDELLLDGATQLVSGDRIDLTQSHTLSVMRSNGDARVYDLNAAQVAPLPDTSANFCYDNLGAVVTCGDLGFPGQDGDFAGALGRGLESVAPDPSLPDAVVFVDKQLGLAWAPCRTGLSGESCASGSEALQIWSQHGQSCSDLNSLNGGAGYAGRQNWRLPDIRELVTIYDFSANTPDFYMSNHTVGGANYIDSATLESDRPGYNMILASDDATVQNDDAVVGDSGAICVSGNGAPNSEALRTPTEVPGEDVITDPHTGLQWQDCFYSTQGVCDSNSADVGATWAGALQDCDNSVWGNFFDWRLPNVIELFSALNLRDGTHAGANELDLNLTDKLFFSSTMHPGMTNVYSLNFADTSGAGGGASLYETDVSGGSTQFYRCVR